MNVLLIQPEGVDLYTTLLNSETSRDALRFYKPDRLEYGMRIRTASLGSALALVSELRWYIQRYVEEVLFEPEEDIFCSSSLAQQIYERDVKPHRPGNTAASTASPTTRSTPYGWMREQRPRRMRTSLSPTIRCLRSGVLKKSTRRNSASSRLFVSFGA